jgi:hypothetical protein
MPSITLLTRFPLGAIMFGSYLDAHSWLLFLATALAPSRFVQHVKIREILWLIPGLMVRGG